MGRKKKKAADISDDVQMPAPVPADAAAAAATNGAQQSGLLGNLMGYLVRAVNDADEDAAAARVAALRSKRPDASNDDLVDIVVRNKCLQTGVIGAVSSSTAMVPGLGTLAALTFGSAIDIGLTFKLQAELVLEIAAIYDHKLRDDEKRTAVMMVTGISAGANRMLNKMGQELAQKATERLAQKSLAKAIPVLGIAASGGTNMLTTYIIGQRAHAYFKQGPDTMADWADILRTLVGVDERKLVGWLSEAGEQAWLLVSRHTRNAGGAVIGVGKSAGKLVVNITGGFWHGATGVVRTIARGAVAGARGVAALTERAVEMLPHKGKELPELPDEDE